MFVISQYFASSTFTGVAIGQYYASSVFTGVLGGQSYASSLFTGTRSPWIPSTPWRRTWRPSWGQNLVWGCSPHPEHLHCKSAMRTESGIMMFTKPRTPSLWKLSKNSIRHEDVRHTQNTSRDAYHTKVTLYENRITREDVHHTPHPDFMRIESSMRTLIIPRSHCTRTESSLRTFTTPRTHHHYENRISRENVHHTQNTSLLWEQN